MTYLTGPYSSLYCFHWIFKNFYSCHNSGTTGIFMRIKQGQIVYCILFTFSFRNGLFLSCIFTLGWQSFAIYCKRKEGTVFSVRVINFFSITWMICLGSPAFYWNVLMLPSVLWLHAVHKLFPTIWWYLLPLSLRQNNLQTIYRCVHNSRYVSFYCEGGERICESLTEYLHKHWGLQNLRPSKPKNLLLKYGL